MVSRVLPAAAAAAAGPYGYHVNITRLRYLFSKTVPNTQMRFVRLRHDLFFFPVYTV